MTTKPQLKEIKVVSQYYLGDNKPFFSGDEYSEGSLDKMIESLQAIRESIPEEFRAVARAWFERDYDGGAEFHVSYHRPETDEERIDRETRLEKITAEVRAREMREFLRLKEKYGDAS